MQISSKFPEKPRCSLYGVRSANLLKIYVEYQSRDFWDAAGSNEFSTLEGLTGWRWVQWGRRRSISLPRRVQRVRGAVYAALATGMGIKKPYDLSLNESCLQVCSIQISNCPRNVSDQIISWSIIYLSAWSMWEKKNPPVDLLKLWLLQSIFFPEYES